MRTGIPVIRSIEVPPSNSTTAPKLTPRENEVLRLLTVGKCNKEIAAAMSISPRTVKFHMTNLLAKFSVTTCLELLAALSRPAELEPLL